MTALSTDWFGALRQQFPTMQLGQRQKSASASNRHPREALLELIDASLAVLADANATVTRRGKQVQIDPCFTVAKGVATVVLSYSRTAIVMPDGSNALTLPVGDLQAMLGALRAAAVAGAFDAQLEAVRAQRVAALKAGIAAKKAA